MKNPGRCIWDITLFPLKVASGDELNPCLAAEADIKLSAIKDAESAWIACDEESS